MKRQIVQMEINGEPHSAEVKEGEVTGWQPLTLRDFEDMLGCMAFLMQIEYAIRETRDDGVTIP